MLMRGTGDSTVMGKAAVCRLDGVPLASHKECWACHILVGPAHVEQTLVMGLCLGCRRALARGVPPFGEEREEPAPKEAPPAVMRTREVAQALRVSESTVRRLAKSGKLKPVPTPTRHMRFYRGDINDLAAPSPQV